MRKMVVMIMLKRIITMIRISEKIRTLRRANDLITFVACVNCPVLKLINMMNKNGLFIWMVIICNNNHNIFLGGLWLSVHRRPDSFSSFTTNPHTSQPTAGYLRLSQAMHCNIHIYIFWNNRASRTTKNQSSKKSQKKFPGHKIFVFHPYNKLVLPKSRFLQHVAPEQSTNP